MVDKVELHPFIAETRPGGRARITLKAAWGEEHVAYTATLLHLLRRLKAVEAVILDASVESRETRALPKNARRLKIRDRQLPIALRDEGDLDDLRSAIQAAQAAVKIHKGTSGGNPTRRLELVVDGGARRWPGPDLQAHLVGRGRFAVRPPTPQSGSLTFARAVPYRREAALSATRERKKFDTNPDLQERGAAAHTKTQNAIADVLLRHGIGPLSSRGGGASFDLGWEWSGVLNVMEVKSVTKANEERQLRLGLGQVLRYRDLARSERFQAKAWLVAERPPTDDAWLRLCSDVAVQLTWPDDFEQRLLDQLRRALAIRGPR
jgi:hypothetical protein